MATELDDDQRFSSEEVSTIVHECIDTTIGEHSFSNQMAATWSSMIATASIANLNKLNKPYKYTILCKRMEQECIRRAPATGTTRMMPCAQCIGKMTPLFA